MGVQTPSLRTLSRRAGVSLGSASRWLRHLGYGRGGYREWLGKTGLPALGYDGVSAGILEAYLTLRRRGLRFYTLPPCTARACIPWPWLLVNVFNVDALEPLLERYREMGARVEAVILDAGVDTYWRRSWDRLSFDYDDAYWERFWAAVDAVRGLARRHGFSYEVVIPDYPDDYSRVWGRRHALWVDGYTNVDRTLMNIEYLLREDPGLPWLIPAQGHEDDPVSLYYSVLTLVELGLARRYRVALANLCTSRRASVIVESVAEARRACPRCLFHVFGPSLPAVRRALGEGLLGRGDSWDSTAWTFPRQPSMWSARGVVERFGYFIFYMRHVAAAAGVARGA